MEKETFGVFPLIYWKFSPGLIPLDDIVKHCKPFDGWLCSVDTTMNSNLQKEWEPFVAHISPCLAELPLSNVQMEFMPLWMNVYKKGDYQEIHNHMKHGASLSYCYFYKVPPDSGKLAFYNEHYRNFAATPLREALNLESFNISEWLFIEAKEGDLVVFPSFMQHMVTQNLTDELRITVSGNLKLTPYAPNQTNL